MAVNVFYELFREAELKKMKFKIKHTLERILHIREFNEEKLVNIINNYYINPIIQEFKKNRINTLKDLSLSKTTEIIEIIKKEFESKLEELVLRPI